MKRSTSKRASILLFSLVAFQGRSALALTITPINPLTFGSIAADSAGIGTVSIATSGSRTIIGGVVALTGSQGGAASFNVTGNPGQVYTITLPSSYTVTSGGQTMTVDNLVSLPATTGTLSGMGTQTILVGGRLNVGSSQAQGAYAGSFSIDVN